MPVASPLAIGVPAAQTVPPIAGAKMASTAPKPMSEYELKRHRNIARNRETLEKLGLDPEAAAGGTAAREAPAAARPRKRAKVAVKPVLPQRRSSRNLGCGKDWPGVGPVATNRPHPLASGARATPGDPAGAYQFINAARVLISFASCGDVLNNRCLALSLCTAVPSWQETHP